MSETMQAAVLADASRIEVVDVPRARPGPRDVLVAPEAVGVCGTDFHIYTGEANYSLDASGNPIPFATAPQILGHEITARVVEVGAEASDVRVGDRVVVDQGINCHSRAQPVCEYCASGDSHQCEFFQEHGISGLQGGFADALAIPAVNVVPIESDLPRDQAAMVEPLGCVLHAFEMLNGYSTRYRVDSSDPVRAVRTVLIYGAGPAGLLFVQVLRNVIGFDGLVAVSDPDPDKRARAEAYGATVIDPTATDLTATIHDLTDGRRVELLVDACGAGQVFVEIPGLIRRQASILMYGHGHGGVGLEVMNNVQWREPALISPIGASGAFDTDHRPAIYRRSLQLIEASTIDVGSLITHRYDGLADIPRAFSGEHREPGYVKGVVLVA